MKTKLYAEMKNCEFGKKGYLVIKDGAYSCYEIVDEIEILAEISKKILRMGKE